MSQNVLVELSDALADATEKTGKATVLVNARRRMPASGIVYASDPDSHSRSCGRTRGGYQGDSRRWSGSLCAGRWGVMQVLI